MAVGVPAGIAAAHRPRLYAVLRPILDLMQTLPTFVYLIPAIVFFGIGMVPGLLATIIFVLPAPIRLTHLQDELIEHQRKLNCSIVFVSHDLEEAFKLGNRIAIMDEGRIVQTGTPRQIFYQPSTDYVQRFVAQINPLQVLTAEDILACSRLSAGRHATTLSRDIDTPASVIMSLMHEHDGPISITREDKVIGQIDKDVLLFCLASYNRK